METTEITKAQLLALLTSWKLGEIDAEALQNWMITHYDPPEVKIGSGEPEWTQEAMNIVMNEYEIAKIEKFRLDNAQYAIDFVNCSESNFNQTKHLFIQDGFRD
ncbi:hypothetical protein L1D44_00050 [Shewanella sp. Isolate13]|uniref:hypothetical protein n=1 Tax=Shewanella sp. Isolate13 TaxID=2908531 RepID=UPI001EFD4134|nr:hypothetical protein [Shewanella sp. Isolate13]MCG9728251.1 hypothetical protein [Shewanella sp. Isolate13]